MYRKTVLDNGLTVVTEEIPEFRSCSLGIWVGVGSRDEADHQAGLSHFLEHILFKGTRHRSAYEIARQMDCVGGQLNAFTDKEHTCFYARVMHAHVPLALEILSDMMLHCLLDAEEVEREKGVILEEIRMFEDTPDDLTFNLFADTLWGAHPLGRRVIGDGAVISALTPATLRKFVSERYRAASMLVSAAGHVDHDDFVSRVEERLAGLSRLPHQRVLEPPRPLVAPQVRYKDCEQAYLCYGREAIPHTDERRYALLVLDSILGGSMSSRLFQEIRENRGLVYSVGTFQNSYFDAGMFGIYAGTSASKVQEVLDVTREILDQMRSHGLTPEELERGREHLKGSVALGMESTSNRMMRLARSELYHRRLISLSEVIQKIDEVTPEAVEELGSWLLDHGRYALAVLGPVEHVDGVQARPLEPDTAAAREAARAMPRR
ncbi:MAG: insulinase family protein [Armatimonadetes bacterium]|nr:insulinase family protein [Armatimonadota bacterium]